MWEESVRTGASLTLCIRYSRSISKSRGQGINALRKFNLIVLHRMWNSWLLHFTECRLTRIIPLIWGEILCWRIEKLSHRNTYEVVCFASGHYAAEHILHNIGWARRLLPELHLSIHPADATWLLQKSSARYKIVWKIEFRPTIDWSWPQSVMAIGVF